MGKKYTSISAKCPYYIYEDKQRVCCEGVQAGATVHMVFQNPARKKKYKWDYCYRNFKECIYYKAITEIKYGGEAYGD